MGATAKSMSRAKAKPNAELLKTAQAEILQTPPGVGDIAEVWKHGRPYKYSSVAEVEREIAGYFAQCAQHSEIPDIAGLCLHLGATRKMLAQWENLEVKPEDEKEMQAFKRGLRNAVSRAKLLIAKNWTPHLLTKHGARGTEFYLKVLGYGEFSGDKHFTINQNTHNTLIAGDVQELAGLFGGLLTNQAARATIQNAPQVE